MYQGRVVEEASARELFSDPKDDYTKTLLAAVPYVGHGAARAVERAAARPSDWGQQAPVVEARGLEIEYPGRFGRSGFRAVDGVDLVIRPGGCSDSSARAGRARPPSGGRSPDSLV
jgi:peptide/nickel transport system ATP-binding protein